MIQPKTYILPAGTEPTASVVSALIGSQARKKDIRTYNKLAMYYDSQPVVSRPAPHQVNVVTNHALYIVNTNVGYLLGAPVNYLASDGVDISMIKERYDEQTISNLDVELETDASIFGHAFERLYLDESKQICSTIVDPREMILVYDDTVQHKKMFAIIYSKIYGPDGKEEKNAYNLTILTDKTIQECSLREEKFADEEDGDRPFHGFDEVPIIEYKNNRNRVGDFEPVISLIDAVNILQSDRVLDREKLVDAILAISGMTLTPEQKKDLKNGRVISGIPAGADIQYIVKNINEADAETLYKTLVASIHKISSTPDMSDENFANNSSGVAIKYKLLAFEQHIKDKERYFDSGLMNRLRIYSDGKFDGKTVETQFTKSLPENLLELAQVINNLDGIVSRETLLSWLPAIKDPAEEVEATENEKSERIKQNKTNSGTSEPSENEEDDEGLESL